MTYYILRDIPLARVYIDDVVGFFITIKEHLNHLEVIPGLIKDHQLRLRISEWFFAKHRVNLLGSVVESRGGEVDEDKFYSMPHSPVPPTKTGLRLFLGPAGYYQKFIKSFEYNYDSLHWATSGVGSLNGTEQTQEAFEQLKWELPSPHVLDSPNFEDPFVA